MVGVIISMVEHGWCYNIYGGTWLVFVGWDFTETKALLGILGDADVKNQLDGIIRNKAIYQKVRSYCHG